MRKAIMIAGVAAAVAGFQAELFAQHHHGDDGRGVRLATDIVNLVRTVVAPAPVVVAAPPPAPVVVAPAPVVVAPAPVVVPQYSYGYYNNVYVPCYSGWYYYGNVWCWGGRGSRPPMPPAWHPHHHHRGGGYYPPPAPRPGPGYRGGPAPRPAPGPGRRR